MNLNKRVQYGLLFVLYLSRSGRTTVSSAAEGLLLKYSFLVQVAAALRVCGVVKSIKGHSGGYELNGDPLILDVFNALSPVQLLSKGELSSFSKGPAEHRAFAQYVNNLNLAISPLLKRKVRNVSNELVATEMARLNRLSPSLQTN